LLKARPDILVGCIYPRVIKSAVNKHSSILNNRNTSVNLLVKISEKLPGEGADGKPVTVIDRLNS
jgi:hypothetical protein